MKQETSDTIRKPLVDKVVLTIDTNQADADAKLKSGQVDANASAAVGAALQAQILTVLRSTSDRMSSSEPWPLSASLRSTADF